MGMKSYKPVYDGVKFKSPMQRMLEEQRAKELAQVKKEESKLEVKEEEKEDGTSKSSNGRKKSES